jgi:hypothetical protein
MDVFPTDLGIRFSFVKTSEFRGGGGLNPPNPHSVRHSHITYNLASLPRANPLSLSRHSDSTLLLSIALATLSVFYVVMVGRHVGGLVSGIRHKCN